MSTRALQARDLLVVEGHANTDEIGRCAMATVDVAGMAFQNHLFRVRPTGVSPEFGCMWLNGNATRAYWRRMCGTSSGLHTINQAMLRAVPLPVPTPTEQAAIVFAWHSIKTRITLESAQLDKLRLQKAGLMHDLLTGRVPVTAAEVAKRG